MSEFEDALKAVREVFINYPRRYEMLKEQLKTVELEIQDLLHVIEFSKFNASEGYKLSKELQKARKERRELKNEMELLETILGFTTDSKPVEKGINRAIGDIRSVHKKQASRSYSMRVRKDLQGRVQ